MLERCVLRSVVKRDQRSGIIIHLKFLKTMLKSISSIFNLVYFGLYQ